MGVRSVRRYFIFPGRSFFAIFNLFSTRIAFLNVMRIFSLGYVLKMR